MADHGSPWTHRLYCHDTPPADSPLVHLWCVSCAQKLSATYPRGPHASATPPFPPEHSVLSLPHPIHSNYFLSNPKPWRSFTLSSTIEASSPRRSIAGDRRRRTTPPDLFFFLGEELPQRVLLLLHLLLQAPSKEDDPELLQAFPVALKPFPVSYLMPVSVSPPRSILHCPRM